MTPQEQLTANQSPAPSLSVIGPTSKSNYLFPEAKYLPLPRKEKNYKRKVNDGYSRMSESSVVICGLTRNTSHTLDRTIAQLEALMKCFGKANVVIFENDSDDSTPAMMEQWSQRDSRVVYLKEDYSDPIHQSIRCLKRAARMAHYRNMVREAAVAQFPSAKWVIVVDTDLRVGFSQEGVANTFGHTDWDMVGSNGILWEAFDGSPWYPVQYDAWAFRFMNEWVSSSNVLANRLTFQRGDPLFPVFSCFGGLAVYRMEAFRSAAYNGSDCEHVPLHRMMRYNGFGRQFLNPSMICEYGAR